MCNINDYLRSFYTKMLRIAPEGITFKVQGVKTVGIIYDMALMVLGNTNPVICLS